MRGRINVLRETGYDTDDSDQISELRNRLNRLNDSDNYTIQPKYKKNPELKHYMYAGQWFLFAIIGLVFMLILLRRDK